MTNENTALAIAPAATNMKPLALFPDEKRDVMLSKIALKSIEMGHDAETTVRLCKTLSTTKFITPFVPADVERKVLAIVRSAKSAVEPVETIERIKPADSLESAKPATADTLDRLKELLAKLHVHKNYSLIRHEFVGLSILLNNQRLLAPAFRPQPKLGLVKGSPIYMDIHRDQVGIDCHWLYCRREHVATRDEELRPLFDLNEIFPFDLAREFAEQIWTKKHRIEQLLVLTPRQQCQLATLRGQNVEGRFKAALKGLGKGHSRVPPKVTAVRLQLYEWAERNKGVRRLLKDYENLWLAIELLGNAAPIRQVAELFSLISGKPKLDDKTVKGKLETLDKNTGGTK